MSALRSFLEGFLSELRNPRKDAKRIEQQRPRPPFEIVRLLYADRLAPEHADQEQCWCNPLVEQVDEGVWLIQHRHFDN